jgi:hypothetical protein
MLDQCTASREALISGVFGDDPYEAVIGIGFKIRCDKQSLGNRSQRPSGKEVIRAMSNQSALFAPAFCYCVRQPLEAWYL